MGWRDLLETSEERVISPWTGGRSLRSGPRTWTIEGALPPEHGWATFAVTSRKATFLELCPPDHAAFKEQLVGYLAGDRLVPDDVRLGVDPARWAINWPVVHLLDPLDRFERIVAGRTFEGGPVIFQNQAFPLGPEEQVRRAFEDGVRELVGIKGVTPALDAAFRMAVFQREEAERRRVELARRLAAEAAARAEQERRNAIVERLGDAQGRREMARLDFGEAARAALAVGGAQYLDHRQSARRGEYAVRFRFMNRRFECIADQQLNIIDAGICLTAHYDDPNFDGGTKGDTWFTLESLPGVIREADEEGKLVVFRHVN